MIISISLICFIALASPASGYISFRDSIPNGHNVPDPKDGSIWPGVGHFAKLGGGARNPFGLDFAANNYQWTKALCEKDSDGDARTNGYELGDPQCTLDVQNPTRTTGITHPGIDDSALG